MLAALPRACPHHQLLDRPLCAGQRRHMLQHTPGTRQAPRIQATQEHSSDSTGRDAEDFTGGDAYPAGPTREQHAPLLPSSAVSSYASLADFLKAHSAGLDAEKAVAALASLAWLVRHGPGPDLSAPARTLTAAVGLLLPRMAHVGLSGLTSVLRSTWRLQRAHFLPQPLLQELTREAIRQLVVRGADAAARTAPPGQGDGDGYAKLDADAAPVRLLAGLLRELAVTGQVEVEQQGCPAWQAFHWLSDALGRRVRHASLKPASDTAYALAVVGWKPSWNGHLLSAIASAAMRAADTGRGTPHNDGQHTTRPGASNTNSHARAIRQVADIAFALNKFNWEGDADAFEQLGRLLVGLPWEPQSAPAAARAAGVLAWKAPTAVHAWFTATASSIHFDGMDVQATADVMWACASLEKAPNVAKDAGRSCLGTEVLQQACSHLQAMRPKTLAAKPSALATAVRALAYIGETDVEGWPRLQAVTVDVLPQLACDECLALLSAMGVGAEKATAGGDADLTCCNPALVDGLLAALLPRVASMDGDEVTIMAVALRRLRWAHPRALRAISDRAGKVSGQLGTPQVAELLWCQAMFQAVGTHLDSTAVLLAVPLCNHVEGRCCHRTPPSMYPPAVCGELAESICLQACAVLQPNNMATMHNLIKGLERRMIQEGKGARPYAGAADQPMPNSWPLALVHVAQAVLALHRLSRHGAGATAKLRDDHAEIVGTALRGYQAHVMQANASHWSMQVYQDLVVACQHPGGRLLPGVTACARDAVAPDGTVLPGILIRCDDQDMLLVVNAPGDCCANRPDVLTGPAMIAQRLAESYGYTVARLNGPAYMRLHELEPRLRLVQHALSALQRSVHRAVGQNKIGPRRSQPHVA